MEKNYNRKIMHEETDESLQESANVEFESKDSIIAVLKKLLGKDKNQSDLQDLTKFAWP